MKDFPSPKARLKFLYEFPYDIKDKVVEKVFDFARSKFQLLYELRNVLAHEVWSSCDDHPGSVLFSSLEENAKLLMAAGKVWHTPEATPRETYEATICFIRQIKVVIPAHLDVALKEAELCSCCFMQIQSVLSEETKELKMRAREPFLFLEAPRICSIRLSSYGGR